MNNVAVYYGHDRPKMLFGLKRRSRRPYWTAAFGLCAIAAVIAFAV
ncbi:MAG: hypothetical protein JO348_13075 [Alphaproteobacteria bacterium]|nr:hypothetical protein [Alphaproteobacteria bacterium]MBV9540316.1 hypothetical protein [Alphaproteobacteria bacterium]MBV9903894.1 hypothetical protein [Alphaproteobacteria bacterium]